MFCLIRMRPVKALIAGLAVATMAAAPPALADDDDDFGGGGGLSIGGGGIGAGSVLKVAPLILGNLPRLSGPKRRAARKVRRERPAPAPARAARGEREIVAVGLSDADVTRFVAIGFTSMGERQIATFGSKITRLRIPARTGTNAAITMVRDTAPSSTVAENVKYGPLSRHVYEAEGATCGDRCEAFELTAWTGDAGRCSAGSRIGVVDTGADLSHTSLAGSKIESRVMRSADRAPSDMLHGTAVLSLLAGKPESNVVGIAHQAQILHADAFHGEGDNARTDVFDLVAAIDWLVSAKVDVLNLSLSGPDNPLLQRAVLAAQNQGIHVVAAAGRPDRSKVTGYPARYDGVIAVGAVDGRLRPSRLSLRGKHVAFAAPGVGLTVAFGKDDVRRVDGTSFATPFVAAAYAMSRARGVPAGEITNDLAGSAQDLGARGRDPVYGWGLVRYTGIPRC